MGVNLFNKNKMKKLGQLERLLEKKLKEIEGSKSLLVANTKDREEFIKDVYENGGQGFVNRLEKYGTTERGEKIILKKYYREAGLLLGDFRIKTCLTTGSAQIGKTLINTCLLVDCITTGRLNAAWFYDQMTNLENNVPLQFKPIVMEWIKSMENLDGKKFNRRNDKQILTRYQVEGCNAIFSYVNTKTKAAKATEGQAVAGGQVVSFQADIAFKEERSQYPLGADDPIERRLDASCLSTKPIRELGTPGGGTGIELEIKKADRHFYPHYNCPSCNIIAPLDPKGCLLKKGQKTNFIGQIEESYFDESGRPIIKTINNNGKEDIIYYWWYLDKNDPINSACICCSKCGYILEPEIRSDAHLRCLKTNQSIDEFLEELKESDYNTKGWKVGIHFSPLCRESESTATNIIRNGLDCVDPTDWQQQALGHSSDASSNSISLEMITRTIGLSIPSIVLSQKKPNIVIAGIDTGRDDDWLVIMNIYFPPNHQQMRIIDIYEKSIREIVYASAINRKDIEDMLKRFNVQYALIDNEPDRESAIKLCDNITNSQYSHYSFADNYEDNQGKIILEMADQKEGYSQIVKKGTVNDGGETYPCWFIRRERFFTDVIKGFTLVAFDDKPLYRLPESFYDWVGSTSDKSPIKHIMNMEKNSKTNKWVKRGRMDIFSAMSFCEASLYIQLNVLKSDVLSFLCSFES